MGMDFLQQNMEFNTGNKLKIGCTHIMLSLIHISFKTGGEISIVACPQTSQQYTACISTFKKNNVPFYILGNGSNLLVLDGGFHGVLVSTVQMDSVSVDGHLITALAGTRLKALVNASVRHGLTGLEFAGGIPGTVGGGVYMNAGAYDGELSLSLIHI